VVLSLAVMSQPGVASSHLGFDKREADDVVGGTRSHARHILIAYAAITILCIGLVWAAGLPIEWR
jgi:trk system potassium uptake protein TrkH